MSSLDHPKLKVSDGILERRSRNSSEDGLQWHPPIGLFVAWKRILGASFIQICKVHTHLPLLILLLHYHCIGQPLRVKHFLNSPSLLKLVYLLLDIIKMLLR